MSATQYLIEEDRQKGRQEGWQDAMLETAKNMLARGVAFDFIKQVTKLSNDTITALMPEI